MNTLNKELVNFCTTYSDQLIGELEGKTINQSRTPIVATALWLRMIENFQGIVSLAEKEKPINGFIVLRSMTETYFLMKKITLDKEFYQVYYNKFLSQKTKRIVRLSKLEVNVGFKLTKEELTDHAEYFRDQIDTNSKVEFKIYEIAKELNEMELYEKVYAHCNIFTHCSAESLERYLQESKDGPILVTNNKVDEDITLTCLMAASLFLKSFELYAKFIEHRPLNAEKFAQKYNELHDQISI